MNGPEYIPEAAVPVVNPFAAEQAVERQPSRLGLGLGDTILNATDVNQPDTAHDNSPAGEALEDPITAAQKTCGLIAAMFVEDGDPDNIAFPVCNDLTVINESLTQLANTPLGLGFGAFPMNVAKAWTRFLHETTTNFRINNGLEPADLVPLRIQLPAWLKDNTMFDILAGCKLMDIEIDGKLESVIARDATYCRIRINDITLPTARIGEISKRSTFIFESGMYAEESFVNAQNIYIHFLGSHDGNIGPVHTSKVDCDGTWSGTMYYKGANCAKSNGVFWRDVT